MTGRPSSERGMSARCRVLLSNGWLYDATVSYRGCWVCLTCAYRLTRQWRGNYIATPVNDFRVPERRVQWIRDDDQPTRAAAA
jgi:hypothetical protein